MKLKHTHANQSFSFDAQCTVVFGVEIEQKLDDVTTCDWLVICGCYATVTVTATATDT